MKAYDEIWGLAEDNFGIITSAGGGIGRFSSEHEENDEIRPPDAALSRGISG